MIFLKNIIICIFITCLSAYPSKQDFSNAFIKVAEKGNPTIVSIVSEKIIENDFHHFFQPFNGGSPKNEQKGHSLGSGVIIDASQGYIITNNHVIKDAEEIKIILYDKRELEAKIIATDPLSDLAVLKVNSINLKEVTIGDSGMLKVGEWVVAIGSPFGLHLNHTVTAGIISAVGRNDVMSRQNFENFIQHDAAINPGNSGGGLFTLDGKLIGINTAIATDGFSRANAGVGFAIPINMVNRIMEDLINDGKVTRGWLGVQIQDLNTNIIKTLKLKNRNGALVSQVIQNSPAKDAGLENKDVITAVNGAKVEDSSHLKNLISDGRPDDKTRLSIIRNGQIKHIVVTLGTRPDQDQMEEVYSYNGIDFDLLGLSIEKYQNVNKNKWNNAATPKGVIVRKVKSNSVAEENNIQVGDIIIEIGKSDVIDIPTYKKELESYTKGDAIMLRILRDETPLYIAFEIK